MSHVRDEAVRDHLRSVCPSTTVGHSSFPIKRWEDEEEKDDAAGARFLVASPFDDSNKGLLTPQLPSVCKRRSPTGLDLI